tara:strand:+ start:43 stop:453 length:411 start_codon:yes stop_codon:yes gene_type:complete
MNDEKKLQRKLDRMGKKKGNTADVSDTRKEINEFIQDNGRPGQKRRAQKLNDKINPSYQGVAPIKGMSDEQAKSIDEDHYPPTSRKSALNMLGVSSPLNACWKTGGPGNKGYVQRGVKKKGGRTVPNCIPKASVKK